MNENLTRYVDLDFASHRRAQLDRIQERWPGNWNDFQASNFGMLLVDLMAWNTATAAFLINRQAGELYVDTMTLRESAVRLGALAGYRLRGPSPATVSCEVDLTNSLDSEVVIHKGTLVQASSGIPFEVSKDYTILPGNTAPVSQVLVFSTETVGNNVLATLAKVTPGSENVDVVDSSIDLTQYVSQGQEFRINATTKPYKITAITSAEGAISNNRLVLDEPYVGTETTFTPAEIIDRRVTLSQGQTIEEQFSAPSQNTANFRIRLGRTPVIDNSVFIEVNGESWEEASSTLDLSPTGKLFVVRTTTSGITIVHFGDGQLGSLVPANSAITVTYRVGGGAVGNIATGLISTSVIGFVSNTQNPVTISLSNKTSIGSGGSDEETLEEARTHIPLAIKSNDRAVTLDDCQEVARSFSSPSYGSVSFAKAFSRSSNSVLEGNIIELYAWTTGPGGSLIAVSPAMKLELAKWMEARSMCTDYIRVMDGTSRPIPVSFRFKTSEGFSLSDTLQLLSDTVGSLVKSLRPGDPIIFSKLMESIIDTQGVNSAIMATPNNDLTTMPTELFTGPDDRYEYTTVKDYSLDVDNSTDGVRITKYQVQLQVSPLAPWSFGLKIGDEVIAVTPGVAPGTARLFNTRVLSTDDIYPSYVNLLTGQAVLWTKGVVGDVTLQLKTMQGYNSDRTVNVYVSYVGLDSTQKRQEIRTRIKAWGDGLSVGGTLYGTEVTGIAVSKSNITEVVAGTDDVDQVTNLTLGTPISNDKKMTAGETELLKIGQIIINGNPN